MKKILLIITLLIILVGCTKNNSPTKYESVDDFKGKRIGVLNGTYQESSLDKLVSDAQKIIINNTAELPIALLTNKIDGYVIDEPIVIMQLLENEQLDYITIPNTEVYSGIIYSSNLDKTIIDDFNQFIKDEKESGYIDSLDKKWIYNPTKETTKKTYEHTSTKTTLRIVVCADEAPYSFQRGNEYDGMLIELFEYFCYKYGYGLEITGTSADGMFASVAANKYDIGLADVAITEERKKNMLFSEPIHAFPVALVYKKQDVRNLEFNNLSQLVNLRMGCMSGSIFDQTIQENFEYKKITYFNSRAELIMGLKQNKIDAYLADEPVAKIVCNENRDIDYIDEAVDTINYGICFSQKAALIKEQFNEYLLKIKENGFKKELEDKWLCADAIDKVVDDITLTGENGVINCCTTPDAAPFSFYKDNEYQGFEVELLKNFAKEYGYKLNISGTSFDAIISSIASNKFDVAFNGIYITPEREKSVDFSDPTYQANVVAVVRNSNNVQKSFIDTIKEKIYSTFIEEDRYQLIIDGILVTLLITFCSILFGTIAGFIFYLISQKVGFTKKIFDFFSYFISRMPVVVLLMILFYIVFAESSISGAAISIIGLSWIFSNSVYEMIKTGVNAIDGGQFEGALALGYTDNQTLFKFIFPQAFRIVMPSYKGEIVSLIKSSSIVGYVTVQDITRVSDIIRSRTYDAFFPLIVTAVIYFILAGVLTKLADHIQKRLIPHEKTKEEILKSVGQNKK